MKYSVRFSAFVALLISACAVGTAPAPTGNGGTVAAPEGDDPDLASQESIVANTDGGASKGSDAGATNDEDAAPPAAKDASTEDSASAVPEAAPQTNACPGYALPNDDADCSACSQSSANCQPNGCYNGYYCELSVSKCRQKPSGC